jgi:hypothetical protein
MVARLHGFMAMAAHLPAWWRSCRLWLERGGPWWKKRREGGAEMERRQVREEQGKGDGLVGAVRRRRTGQ